MKELQEKYKELTSVIKFLHTRYSRSHELAILKTINILNEERTELGNKLIDKINED